MECSLAGPDTHRLTRKVKAALGPRKHQDNPVLIGWTDAWDHVSTEQAGWCQHQGEQLHLTGWAQGLWAWRVRVVAKPSSWTRSAQTHGQGAWGAAGVGVSSFVLIDTPLPERLRQPGLGQLGAQSLESILVYHLRGRAQALE